MTKNNKIWQKNASATLDLDIEAYTVGNDHLLDQELLAYDARASIAHAKMLASIGILTEKEYDSLSSELEKIIILANSGGFLIEKSEEDCHTAIENFLTEKLGDIGKKIHTGRSRNDQILVAMRLYMKAKIVESQEKVSSLISAIKNKSQEYPDVDMPGYTHMQRAMPSSVTMWLDSFADALKDDQQLLTQTAILIDQNPLGSVVGYGEKTLGLDRVMTTELLGFAKVQENPQYCALSRGKFEWQVLQSLAPIMFDIGKLATDLMLFTTKEFGFVSLPKEFTTGSSAMPQKRNYDVCELMRAHCSAYPSTIMALGNIIDKLPSGYNRDFQLTKEPFMKGMTSALATIGVATSVVEHLVVHEQKMKDACSPELYATEEAYRMVKADGVPFRDAYRIVADRYNK